MLSQKVIRCLRGKVKDEYHKGHGLRSGTYRRYSNFSSLTLNEKLCALTGRWSRYIGTNHRKTMNQQVRRVINPSSAQPEPTIHFHEQYFFSSQDPLTHDPYLVSTSAAEARRTRPAAADRDTAPARGTERRGLPVAGTAAAAAAGPGRRRLPAAAGKGAGGCNFPAVAARIVRPAVRNHPVAAGTVAVHRSLPAVAAGRKRPAGRRDPAAHRLVLRRRAAGAGRPPRRCAHLLGRRRSRRRPSLV